MKLNRLFHLLTFSLSLRRGRLKGCLIARKDEFELEQKCVDAVQVLCGDLRIAIDQVMSFFPSAQHSVKY